ncbi:CRISPR-associated protein, Cmr4 family [Ferrithrix thermotolerans DSM 19514]|jgi:CRISPR-associated protein Cmr4|uniref:CRISPR-associated protein, Cmr4 family n=1 Tax=Ferrithrix thermotolerans DSM 19514 TaxID=1121881 RepID=A0A1M4XP36_9ACTN|nr:type III-B CRISPR module RAMP protein Cmr4 [Ferrithrix thermotolerans]SHE94982.1 CRISPR-associated protein, Cmr4 family [Ferrithrix thermotolerans DSM 19514]
MFEESPVMLYYALTPVHMGAGDGLGVVDAPIQRDVVTGYPVMYGSGIKGALRHGLGATDRLGEEKMTLLFGPSSDKSSEHAGALSFTDAHIVLFPVKALDKGFVYVTSPYALMRLARSIEMSGGDASWSLPKPSNGDAYLVGGQAEEKKQEKVYLEYFEFDSSISEELSTVAHWIADNVDPFDSEGYFHKKILEDIVLLSEENFRFFVSNHTSVEPHVKIDDETGTADGGALFYVENLPPETVMAGNLLVSKSRKKDSSRSAQDLLNDFKEALDNLKLVQFGGDATYGRGLMQVSLVIEETL